MKHTPGPWEIDHSLEYYKPCIRHNGIIVAFLADNSANLIDPSNQREEDAANTKLIAAAPDLLEAIQLALRNEESRLYMLPSSDDYKNSAEKDILSAAIGRYRAAIAKATGTAI